MCAKKTSNLDSDAAPIHAERREFLRMAGGAALAPLAGGLTALSPAAIAGGDGSNLPEVAGTVLSKTDEAYEISRQALSW